MNKFFRILVQVDQIGGHEFFLDLFLRPDLRRGVRYFLNGWKIESTPPILIKNSHSLREIKFLWLPGINFGEVLGDIRFASFVESGGEWCDSETDVDDCEDFGHLTWSRKILLMLPGSLIRRRSYGATSLLLDFPVGRLVFRVRVSLEPKSEMLIHNFFISNTFISNDRLKFANFQILSRKILRTELWNLCQMIALFPYSILNTFLRGRVRPILMNFGFR